MMNSLYERLPPLIYLFIKYGVDPYYFFLIPSFKKHGTQHPPASRLNYTSWVCMYSAAYMHVCSQHK